MNVNVFYKYIDDCQYICQNLGMATRARPMGCCAPTAVKPLSDGKLEQIAAAAKALADPTRIEVLRFIAAQTGPVCACDIVDRFDLSQPTMSHHLKTLKEAGLLRASKSGLWAMYEIEKTGSALLGEVGGLLNDG